MKRRRPQRMQEALGGRRLHRREGCVQLEDEKRTKCHKRYSERRVGAGLLSGSCGPRATHLLDLLVHPNNVLASWAFGIIPFIGLHFLANRCGLLIGFWQLWIKGKAYHRLKKSNLVWGLIQFWEVCVGDKTHEELRKYRYKTFETGLWQKRSHDCTENMTVSRALQSTIGSFFLAEICSMLLNAVCIYRFRSLRGYIYIYI